MILAWILVCLPFVAAAGITIPALSAHRSWIDRATAVTVLLLAFCLPWQSDPPTLLLSLARPGLLAVILMALANAGASMNRPAVGPDDQALFGCLLLAALAASPLLIVTALTGAVTAALGRALTTGRTSAWHRVPLSGAGLGLVLFGIVAPGSTLAAGGVVLGLATLMLIMPEALAVLLMAGASLGHQAGAVLIVSGLAALLGSAGLLLTQPDHPRPWTVMTLGQAGVVAVAFGLGSPDGLFGGAVLLVLLVLSHIAAMLARPGGADALVAAAGLMGVPPFGVFPGLALVLLAAARQVPWVLLPLLTGLGLLGWAMVIRLPAPRLSRSTPGPVPLAWLPITLALLFGFCLPAAGTEWLRALALEVGR